MDFHMRTPETVPVCRVLENGSSPNAALRQEAGEAEVLISPRKLGHRSRQRECLMEKCDENVSEEEAFDTRWIFRYLSSAEQNGRKTSSSHDLRVQNSVQFERKHTVIGYQLFLHVEMIKYVNFGIGKVLRKLCRQGHNMQSPHRKGPSRIWTRNLHVRR